MSQNTSPERVQQPTSPERREEMYNNLTEEQKKGLEKYKEYMLRTKQICEDYKQFLSQKGDTDSDAYKRVERQIAHIEKIEAKMNEALQNNRGIFVEHIQQAIDIWKQRSERLGENYGLQVPSVDDIESKKEPSVAGSTTQEEEAEGEEEEQEGEEEEQEGEVEEQEGEEEEQEGEEEEQEGEEEEQEGEVEEQEGEEETQKKQEFHELSPEEVAEMKEKHMELLRTYRSMSKEQLLAKTNPEEIARHEKDGTLYVLLLAINSKDENNIVENSDRSESMYENIIDNVVDEGTELRKEIAAARRMSTAQLRQKLSSPPLADFFKQEKLPRVDIQLSQMNEEQLRTLYESCLLEQQVRDANIMYRAGGSFWETALPERGYNVYRQGDCNTVASYYHSLASLSGSKELSSSLKSVIVDGHAQICFDLGKDKRGKQIRLSKNTSHVDMSKVDARGRWEGNNYPYVHNFYDVQHDMEDHGANIDKSLRGADALVAAQIGELRERGVVSKSSNAKLQREKGLSEKVLSLNPYDATENSNYISGLFFMLDRNLISETEVKQLAGNALENYIAASYWSGFPLINFTRRFGEPEARKYIVQYENKIMGDPTGFSKFVRSSVSSMRDIPGFDRRLTGTESSVSLDVENRKNMLRSVATILSAQRAKQICQQELSFLNEEIDTWKQVST